MFCKSCGKEIDVDSSFCSYCGVKQSESKKPVEPIITSAPLKESLDKAEVKSAENKENQRKDNQRDGNSEKDKSAIIFGVLIIIASVILYINRPSDLDPLYNQYRMIAFGTSVLLRILVIIWVTNIAKRLNRNPIGFGVFAFFIPSIALIIVGLLTKKQKKLIDIIKEGKTE